MVKLSLAMIVKDEEPTIERVLSCATLYCDELIVVDTGSTDRTVALAERMGAKVFHFKWLEDFAAARNYAFECCTGDWIMVLDADDVVTQPNQEKILTLKETVLDDSLDGVFLCYQLAFSGAGECIQNTVRHNLVRKDPQIRWIGAIHEGIELLPSRTILRKDICVEHRTLPEQFEKKKFRNITMMEKSLQAGERTQRNLYLYGRELMFHRRFEDALNAYLEFFPVGTDPRYLYLAYLDVIQCLKMLNRHEEISAWCLKAIMQDSERAEGFVELGVTFYEKEHWRKAIPFFKTAAQLVLPASMDEIKQEYYSWIPYAYLCNCYANVGDYKNAVDAGMQTVTLGHPERGKVLDHLSWMMVQLKNKH